MLKWRLNWNWNRLVETSKQIREQREKSNDFKNIRQSDQKENENELK